MNDPHLARILPHTAPHDGPTRAVLVAMRRMAIHGLHDASAALLMFEHFGLHFRKPLVLMRALLLEVSQTTRKPIQIAPCCAPRMTPAENALMRAMASAHNDPAKARQHLRDLTQAPAIEGLLATTLVLASALHDSGRIMTFEA
jgi:hypothetical protein